MTRKIFKILIIFTLLFLLINTSFAVETLNTTLTTTTLNNAQIHKGDLFLSEQNSVLSDDVDGNVFVISQSAIIDSKINGDLFVMASDVEITENAVVDGNIFIGASNVKIFGKIHRDAYIACQDLLLGSNAIIEKSLNAVAANISLDGTIERNANLSVDTLNLSNTPTIKGDLNYSSANEGSFGNEFVIGNINYTPVVVEDTKQVSISDYISKLIKTLILTLLTALIIFWLFPNYADKSKDMLSQKALPTILCGFAGLFLVPIIILILMITIIGLVPAIILLFIYIIALIIASSVLSIAIGRIIAGNAEKTKTILFSLLASLVIWLLKLIPIVGGFISFIVLILGLGILVYGLFYKQKVEEQVVKE